MQSAQILSVPPGVMQQTQSPMPQQPMMQMQPTPMTQSQPGLGNFSSNASQLSTMSSCAASMRIDPDAMWKNLLPGKYAVLIPEFRRDPRQRDVRVYEEYIPKVIDFLEAWDNVPQNKTSQWCQSALASYSILDRLRWIFQLDKPQEWIKPMPDASLQVIFEEPKPVSQGPSLLSNFMPAFPPSVPAKNCHLALGDKQPTL
eukprot:4821319-Amphidinium_carterae.1